MSGWKTLLGLAAVAVSLWLLYPSGRAAGGRDSDVVEITFMGPGGPISGALADAVSEFERRSIDLHRRDPSHPIYKVISGQNAAADQVADPTRFLVSVAGGEPPDIIHFDRYAVAEWASRGAFSALDPYISRDLDDVRTGRRRDFTEQDIPTPNRFFTPCWQEAMYQGKVFGIPNSADDRALLYNKDLLVRAGLVYRQGPLKGQARPPGNWRELEDYAVRLTEYDSAGRLSVVGFAPNYGNSWLYMYGWMAGGEFMSADGGRCTLNSPQIVRGLAFMKEIYDLLGGYDKVQAFQAALRGMGGSQDPFIAGKVAMKIDGSGAMVVLATYGRDVNFGVAPPPLPQDRIDELKAQGKEPLMSWMGGWTYAIPANARHKEAAWEFIRFMTSDRAFRIQAESSRVMAEAQGRLYVPEQYPSKAVNESFYQMYVAGNARLPERFKEGFKVYNDLLPYSRFRPITPVGQLLWNEHNSAMEDALLNKKSPQESLDYHAANVQRDLDKILRPPAGRPITTWTWFFVLYGALLAAFGALGYLWDTHAKFRRRVARVLRIKSAGPGVIDGRHGGYFRRQWIGGIVCAAPWIVGFILFAGGPMLFSLVMSLCDFDVINPARYIGVQNYAQMFTQDELFPKALYNTVYMIIGVPLGMAVSLLIAMLLNLKVRGIAVWRTFFYLPSIVPMVAGSILWIWIFNPQGGLLNSLLSMMGIPGPLWLQSEVWSKPSLILMGLWGAGSGMIIWLAGLKGIDRQLYEAAEVDGAGAWSRFWHVTIPQLTPYIFFNLIMGTIGTFQIFGQAFIMTQGGPANSTLFYVYHLFNNAFRYGHMGYAAAMAWVLFAIIFAMTLIQMKLSRRWVHYESE